MRPALRSSTPIAWLLVSAGCSGRARTPAVRADRPSGAKEAPWVARRELLLRLDRLRAAGDEDADLSRALASLPPRVFWREESVGGKPSYSPVPPPRPSVQKTVRADIAVIGSEIESLTTAMAAAKEGLTVALITDAPLGGVCSEASANLRYVDGLPGTPRTPSQIELYRALDVRGGVAIPRGVEERIRRLLARRYANRIRVVKTGSLSDLTVDLDGRIRGVATEAGVRVIAARYLDTDPECRLGELCGLPLTPKTPALSYGLNFDVAGLARGDARLLLREDRLRPERILRWVGASKDAALQRPGGAQSLDRLRAALRHPATRVFENSAYGYAALAAGFDFSMRCREAARPSADLVWLNARRDARFFEVARFPGESSFKGLAYRIDETVLQHAHSLRREARWRPFGRAEGPGLQAFFRYVTGDPSLSIRLPGELYVRRQTASVETLSPYEGVDVALAPRTRWWMAYSMEPIGVVPRPGYDDDLMADLAAVSAGGVKRWDCLPSTLSTAVPNLFLLNKCAVSPRFSAGLRIAQNLVNTGQAWVESLPRPSVKRPKNAS